MNEPIDDLLKQLGEGPPFPVDWQAYERELAARIVIAQVRRRRRTWWTAVSGALVGAAAMFVAAVSFMHAATPAPEPPQPPVVNRGPGEVPEVEPESAPTEDTAWKVVACQGGGFIRTASAPPPEMKPFTRRTSRKDGSTSEVRFEGFSTSQDASGMIGISKKSQ